jgi:hypothetical protein
MPARVDLGHERVVPSEKSDGDPSAELAELTRTSGPWRRARRPVRKATASHRRSSLSLPARVDSDTSASSRKESDGDPSAELAELTRTSGSRCGEGCCPVRCPGTDGNGRCRPRPRDMHRSRCSAGRCRCGEGCCPVRYPETGEDGSCRPRPRDLSRCCDRRRRCPPTTAACWAATSCAATSCAS